MKGLWIVPLLLGTFLTAPAGATSIDACETAVATFKAEQARIWRQAGSPTYICAADNHDGHLGEHVDGVITIEVQPDDANYLPLIAHETGHAWADAHNVVPAVVYGDTRGFPRPVGVEAVTGYGAVLHEDYAETFAWALGYWRPLVGVQVPPPLAFQNEAGIPTPVQVSALRAARILPSLVVLGGPGCPV